MKEKEGFVDCPEQQMILYVEKENGQFGPMQTGSYITKNYIDDFFTKRNNLIASLQEQIRQREFSPIHLFLILEDLTINELSARTRIPSRKIKKHLIPDHFEQLPEEILNRYAVVFNVTLEQMLNADPGTHSQKAEYTKP